MCSTTFRTTLNPMSETNDNTYRPTQWAELDLRSLALFRIALGGFILLDLALRLFDLGAFYTDDGVLPRLALVRSAYADNWLCFHLGSGDTVGQAVLFLLAGFCGLGLLVGWRTPQMSLASWFLINSLHARNPFVSDRGDLELSLMLLWGVFLPLGACYSLDQRAGRKPFGQTTGFPAAALVGQFAAIYLFAALLKTGDFWLARGDGLKHSLMSPMFANDSATWLLESAAPFLGALNYSVIAGELLVALLLMCPVSVPLLRSLAALMLMVFHLAVAVLFQLGLFPFIGAVLPLVLLPKEFWERVGRHWTSVTSELPEPPKTDWRLQSVTAVMALLALLSNLDFQSERITLPPVVIGLNQALKLEQHWDLFSPLPPINGTFELLAVGPQGQERFLFRGPPDGSGDQTLTEFPNHRWRMLMLSSLYPEFVVVREGLARTLLRREDAQLNKDERLLYRFLHRPVDPKGSLGEPVQVELWRQPS
jgi:HTTM domain